MADKPPRTNSVFHDSPIKKNLVDYKYDTVYFGTPHKQSMTMRLDDVLFLTPLKGIASIFAVRPQYLQKYIIKSSAKGINRDFKEWSRNSTEYLSELHVFLRGKGGDIEVKDTEENATGYVYELKLTPELKKHIWWGNKMGSPDFEVVLKDVKEVTFDNEKEVNIKMYITKDPRQPIPINEQSLSFPNITYQDGVLRSYYYIQEGHTNKSFNCISYAMGVDDSIYDLKKEDFEITEDDGDYKVRFNSDNAAEWEKYIKDHIQDTFWNEYINLDDHEINFLIKENGKIKRYINTGFNENPKLLAICNRLCEGDFKTMKALLLSNDFYKSYIQDWDKNINEGCNDMSFSESYIPDATTGTSDFDEKDDDPEDCFCESTNINEGCDNMPLSEFDHYFQEGLFQNIFSKEKRAKKFINNGITNLLPAFINDLDKINTAYNSMKYNRRLIMRMYYPRTVYTTQTVYDTHYGPNGSIYTIPRTVTTSHQEPTPEMLRLNSVAYFFKRITKKVHIMDMVNCPDTVYGALNASGNMYKEIYVVFGSKNVNDALAKLYATTLELSNHINSFIGVLSAKSDAANVCDAIDVNAVDPDLPDIELPPLEENDPDLIQESMSAKERNALKNSDFAYIKRDSKGKVVERKYPINNEAHVKSAAHLFPRGIPDDPKIRKKVANKILRKAHSYGMDTSGWTSLNKAAGKTVKEGYEETMVADLYQESTSKSFRAQYKDPAYFDKFIINEEESIKRFKGVGKEDKNSIIAGKYLKLISAKYSNGESKKAIKADVDNMFKYVKDVSSYNDMVDYLSLAILFDIDRKKIYNVMKCDKYDDVFITGLKKYVDKKDHSVTYAGLKYPKQYETFNKALNGEINGEELDKYINSRWYPSCKGRAFYDDHKSKTDTYCGYWCWVGGAVAKIKSMNKDMTSKYTPTDLI